MTLTRNLIVALTVTGSAALAAVFAAQRRRTRLSETEQHKGDLQRWENETGGIVPTTTIEPLS